MPMGVKGRAYAHATEVKVKLDGVYVVSCGFLRSMQPSEGDRVVDLEAMQPRIRTATTGGKLDDSVQVLARIPLGEKYCKPVVTYVFCAPSSNTAEHPDVGSLSFLRQYAITVCTPSVWPVQPTSTQSLSTAIEDKSLDGP